MYLADGVKCYGEVTRPCPSDFMRWFFLNGGSGSNVS